MNAQWIDHPGALDRRAPARVVGLDTEFMRRNTYFLKLALVQAADTDSTWLLDPLAYDVGADVRDLVGGATVVMHSASEDLEALLPFLDATPLDLFDTQIAAAMCGLGAGLGYQKLVATLLGIDIAKGETRSDWLQRPLTASQLDYAAQDVLHLAAVHARLAEELDKRGRLAWLADDCRRLVERAQERLTTPDPEPQRAFPSAADWPADAQVRLRRVLLWREANARALDKPKPWILDDGHALDLSMHPPATSGELFDQVRGQRALRGPQRAELLDLLARPIDAAERETLAPIPARPSNAVRHATDAMRGVVNNAATRLDLPPGLLAPRRLLEEYAGTGVWPHALQGWRHEILHVDLAPLLPAA